jgi:hypothetical protein
MGKLDGSSIVSFSDEYFQLCAMKTALEWFLFRAVSEAKNPRETLKDFQRHMDDLAEFIRATAMAKLGDEVSPDTFINMLSGASAVDDCGRR